MGLQLNLPRLETALGAVQVALKATLAASMRRSRGAEAGPEALPRPSPSLPGGAARSHGGERRGRAEVGGGGGESGETGSGRGR